MIFNFLYIGYRYTLDSNHMHAYHQKHDRPLNGDIERTRVF